MIWIDLSINYVAIQSRTQQQKISTYNNSHKFEFLNDSGRHIESFHKHVAN